MSNLIALCKPQSGHVIFKRVQISQPLQEKISGLFQQQALDFMEGVDEEVEFGSDWKPDTNEVMTIGAPDEILKLESILDQTPLELDRIDAQNFQGEGIRALAVAVGNGNGGRRVLVQRFTAQQLLAKRRFSLLLEGDTFRELTEPSFTLDTQLTAIVEKGRLIFKSFHKVRSVFELRSVYQEATDQEVESFCAHESLFADSEIVKATADQVSRKLIHAIAASNVLDRFSVTDIAAKAMSIGFELSVEDGRILLPSERRSLKDLLRFLDDAIYEGPISAQRFVTNSKRPYR